MDTTITLDEPHFQLAVEKARSLGTTPEAYLATLIEADARSFDDILAPARRGFESMDDADLDALLSRATMAARFPNGEAE